VFLISYLCWIAGSWAYLAATPDKMKTSGVGWSLICLEAGSSWRSCRPDRRQLHGPASRLHEGGHPAELYIKTAIVILGGFLG